MINIFSRLDNWLNERYQKKHAKEITVATIYTVWDRIGKPTMKDVGKYFIEVQMNSSKVAVYKLTNYLLGWGQIDWYWLVFNFDHYKKSNEKDYPRYE